MSKNYVNVNSLKVSKELLDFINEELLKDTGITPERFWSGFEKSVDELAPKNRELIKIRQNLQKKIDEWHIKNKGNQIKIDDYKKFLTEIGYLKEVGPDFKIETSKVDSEISKLLVLNWLFQL